MDLKLNGATLLMFFTFSFLSFIFSFHLCVCVFVSVCMPMCVQCQQRPEGGAGSLVAEGINSFEL